MKFPNHIILDVSKPLVSHSNQYWIFKYLFNAKKSINFFQSLTFHKNFFLNKEKLLSNKLMNSQKNFTIKYSLTNPALFLNNSEKLFFKKKYTPLLKVKHREIDSTSNGKLIFDYLNTINHKFDKKSLKRLLKNFSYNSKLAIYKSNNLWNLFNINFLRKEKIYTKLKYSRVPQYDIVSGGAAALLAGFLGFLITEKFGFELPDSADFYFLFMYLVFLFFGCRLFLKLIEHDKSSWNIFSLKWLIFFLKTLVFLFINFFKFFIRTKFK